MTVLKSGVLSRIVPARRETVKFFWVQPDFSTAGPFNATRRRLGVPTIESCWWCRTKFPDDETLGLANVEGKGNKLLCEACVSEATSKESPPSEPAQ